MNQCPGEVVVLAARRDSEALSELRRHARMVPEALLWHLSDVPPGASISQEQQAHMDRARIIVILLSADLLANHNDEVVAAQAAWQGRGAVIIPVVWRPALLPAWLIDLNPMPDLSDPIAGRDPARRDAAWVQVCEAIRRALSAAPSSPAAPRQGRSPDRVDQLFTILFLSSDPDELFRVKTADEAREVERRLQLARHRDRFRLIQRHATTRGELLQIVIDAEPTILHFCGHGSKNGIVLKEEFTGKAAPVSGRALAALFAALDESRPRLLMLNACYSKEQADVLCQEVDCVVGIDGVVDDSTAIAFSGGFYLSLFAGKSVHAATQLAMANAEIGQSDKAHILHLRSRQGVDPRQVRFV